MSLSHSEYTHIWESRHYINGNLRKDAVFSDKHLEISEKPDDFFSREGDDLHCEVKVPIHKLVLGGTQRIPTLARPGPVPAEQARRPWKPLRGNRRRHPEGPLPRREGTLPEARGTAPRQGNRAGREFLGKDEEPV